MSSLLSFLSPQKIEESLPEKVMPLPVKSASVVQSRMRSRYIPTSGSTYSAPSGAKIIQFRITGNDYLDLSTACLHFRFQNGSTAPASALLQEGAFSVIQRVRTSLNSVIVEDTDNAHICAHTKVLNSFPREQYESALGQYMGLYKKSRSLGTTYPPALANIIAQVSGYYNATEIEGTNGSSFYVPLTLIASSTSMKQFLPLRNVGNIELTFFLEDASACLYGVGGVTGAKYTMTDVSLEVDTVQLNNVVVEMMDRLASDTSDDGGITITVPSTVSQSINYDGSGEKTISISRGTTSLTQLTLAKRLQTQVGTSANQSLSSFQCFGQTASQIRLGSKLFPTTKTDSLARAFTETAHAYGGLNNVDAHSLVSRRDYEVASDSDQGAFTYSYNFRRVLTTAMDLDGENTIQSGSIIQYTVADNAGAPVTLTAVIESLRYVELKGSAVNVVGL
jgi:hypothetical protein